MPQYSKGADHKENSLLGTLDSFREYDELYPEITGDEYYECPCCRYFWNNRYSLLPLATIRTSVGNVQTEKFSFSTTHASHGDSRGANKSDIVSHVLAIATEHHSVGLFESYTENDYKFVIVKLGSNRDDENLLQHFHSNHLIEIQSGNDKPNVVQSNRHRRDMDVVNIFETYQFENSKLEKSFVCIFSECRAQVKIVLDENNLSQSKVFIDITNTITELGEGTRFYPSPSPSLQTHTCSITSEKCLGAQSFSGLVITRVLSNSPMIYFIPNEKQPENQMTKSVNLDPSYILRFDYAQIMTLNESKFFLIASAYGNRYEENSFVLREIIPTLGENGQVETCKMRKFHVRNFYKYFTKLHQVIDYTTISDGKYLFLLNQRPKEKVDTFEKYQSSLLWIVLDLISCTAKRVLPVHYKNSDIDAFPVLRKQKLLDEEGFEKFERKKKSWMKPNVKKDSLANSAIPRNLDLENSVKIFGYHSHSVTNRDLFSVLLLFRSNFEDKSLRCHNRFEDVAYHQYTFKFTDDHIPTIGEFNNRLLSDVTITAQH
ncbi:hypothetical protein FDP41_009957 [Naegleria fowleri]|uniref:Uncharacterized protein n=1 Tax=Naegleria fowleri TaxID=5763 RepID=A0A6A5BC99_NAEFO|nr:uncharacterized protein FDP41_009957 [Naegleria fowleri]KAF0971734.1 hypothetical protein FDP41_009957 [Naegleria fowleri]